jgi:hypothetical protein
MKSRSNSHSDRIGSDAHVVASGYSENDDRSPRELTYSFKSSRSARRGSAASLINTASISVRKGKWTTEEENYSNKLISLFNKGLLPIPTGTTLRSYLSDKLNW